MLPCPGLLAQHPSGSARVEAHPCTRGLGSTQSHAAFSLHPLPALNFAVRVLTWKSERKHKLRLDHFGQTVSKNVLQHEGKQC